MSGLRAFLTHRTTVRVAQIVSGLLLGWAALAKLGDLTTFARQVHNFRVLPIGAENLVAMTLPWIELLSALSLVLAVRPRAGAYVTTGLLAVFTLGVIQAVLRGLDFECGCFGTSDHTRVGLEKILQNCGMLGIAAIACLRPGSGTRESGTVTTHARALSPEI